MKCASNSEACQLADQLERSFHGGAWHGTATREALSGIDAAVAGQKPAGHSHSIVELVRHITFWVKAAKLRVVDGRDVASESDWQEKGTLADEDWTAVIGELERAHADLHAVLLDLDDGRLNDAVPGSDPTVRGLLLGVLQHNAYHTGQIVQLAKEMAA